MAPAVFPLSLFLDLSRCQSTQGFPDITGIPSLQNFIRLPDFDPCPKRRSYLRDSREGAATAHQHGDTTLRRHTKLTLAVICLAPAAVAATYAGEPLVLQPQSRVWIEGSSNVRDFTCTTTSFETRVQSSVPGAVSAVLAGTKAVESAELAIPAASLDCRNGKMNDHMLKALKAKENPTIAFRITTYDVAKATAGVNGTATGQLTLGGVTKTITVTAHATPDASGALRLTGSYQLKMTDYGLTPPSLMMGTLKVNESVKVGFDMLLKGEAPTM
jgi:polyisoprenoid-binding protein YceI